ncbi:conserved hypothetical protein [Candidatus Terasakiella magnetica]|uniref:DNA repair photolyase n=1 Tax=Candidatus Terasakiella magnetica TaxID=1867952 RepID=A0A1C3RGQ5_9PROT|nr:DUF1848 domain-containing protein [Candidatus Terasakiella magnetica]SCA56477.1 conserved hypothetical protein [Candidatus Terasakiella magnetica]
MIISASRRTDIPAFYSKWFINRLRAGFVQTRNPFNYHQVKKVSLLPQDVDCIVFWTRNPAPLMDHLGELDDLKIPYYFHYTITGYPRALERKTPKLDQAIETFQALSERIGPERVIWRYDPILLSNLVQPQDHMKVFGTIAGKLKGHSQRAVISMADFYTKTERNLDKIEGLNYDNLRLHNNLLEEFINQFKNEADRNGLTLYSCAEESDLECFGISAGQCIDEGLISRFTELKVRFKKDSGQRKNCGCVKSVDIGAYNSCLHGCEYCYATYNQNRALTNAKKHDPESPFLIE